MSPKSVIYNGECYNLPTTLISLSSNSLQDVFHFWKKKKKKKNGDMDILISFSSNLLHNSLHFQKKKKRKKRIYIYKERERDKGKRKKQSLISFSFSSSFLFFKFGMKFQMATMKCYPVAVMKFVRRTFGSGHIFTFLPVCGFHLWPHIFSGERAPLTFWFKRATRFWVIVRTSVISSCN